MPPAPAVPRRAIGWARPALALAALLTGAPVADAAVPTTAIEDALAHATADLAACASLAGEAPARWTVRLGFRGERTEAEVTAGPSTPEIATACVRSRLSEVLVPWARGLDWVRTLQGSGESVQWLPLEVSNRQLTGGSCLDELGGGRVPGGLIGLAQPAGQGLRAIVEQADHPELARCLVAAGGPPATDAVDHLVFLHLPVDVPAEDDPWSHTTLSGPSSGADGLLATLDREWLQHGLGAHPVDLAARYTALCDEGVALACGWEDWHVPDGPLDLDRLHAAFAPACEAGDPVACVPVAWRLIQGAPGRYSPPGPDPELGYALLDGACERGSLRACSEAAVWREGSAANAALLDACARGDGHGCYHLGRAEEKAAPYRARALYEHALAAGEPAAWAPLGGLWERGLLGGPQMSRAADAWIRGCASGDRQACRTLRALYLDPPSPEGADRAADRGCQAGDADLCHTLGRERLTERNHPRGAADAFERGCALGHPASCGDLAALWHHAPLLAPSPEEVTDRLQRACVPGDATTWQWCAAAEHLRHGGRLGSPSARATLEGDVLEEALACVGELGRVDLRLVVRADGRIAETPRITSSLATDAAGRCAQEALQRLRLPPPRDRGSVFVGLVLDGPSSSTRIDTFPAGGPLPPGALRVASIHETGGSDTLAPVIDALQRDAGLGLCFDGTEAWPGVVELAVKPTGKTASVKLVTSTGSEDVDDCLVARTRQLQVAGGVRVRTPVGFQIGPAGGEDR